MALALHWLSACTASLHGAPGRFMTMLNPREILTFAPWQDVRFGSKADICAAKSDVRFTADFRTRSCPLYPRKRTCAVQLVMSALGQKQTFSGAFELSAKGQYQTFAEVN
jgi:hypothetical protein